MDPQLQSEPVQQPVASPPPPQVPSSGIPKILLIILALVVLVGITAGSYILGTKQNQSKPVQKQQTATIPTPTPLPSKALTKEGDITANWKTYKNAQLGISFKYPNSWVTKSNEIESTYLHGVVALDPEGQEPQGPLPSAIAVSYWDNPDQLSIKDLDRKYTGARGSPGLYSPTAQKVIGPVGPALHQANANCEPVLCDKILISYKDKVWELTEYYNSVDDPNRESQKEVLNQILSTFKFTQ